MTAMRPCHLAALTLLAQLAPAGLAALPTAEEVLTASIGYHDPSGHWGESGVRLTVAESRPDGSTERTELEIDPRSQHFAFRTESAEGLVEGELTGERCVTRVDGSEEISEAKRQELRLSCDRLPWLRNYYSYLWGLPMKLRDPGTIVHPEVAAKIYAERELLEVKVTYREDVGGDTWYFYFDPQSHALAGYRFYHDVAKGDGEYILLEGEVAGANLRLPSKRAWFTHAEDRYLGTDTLLSIERLDR